MRLWILALAAVVLAGCVTTVSGEESLQRMQRNHNAALQSAG